MFVRARHKTPASNAGDQVFFSRARAEIGPRSPPGAVVVCPSFRVTGELTLAIILGPISKIPVRRWEPGCQSRFAISRNGIASGADRNSQDSKTDSIAFKSPVRGRGVASWYHTRSYFCRIILPVTVLYTGPETMRATTSYSWASVICAL